MLTFGLRPLLLESTSPTCVPRVRRLADLYVDSLEAADYATFLLDLLGKVTGGHLDGGIPTVAHSRSLSGAILSDSSEDDTERVGRSSRGKAKGAKKGAKKGKGKGKGKGGRGGEGGEDGEGGEGGRSPSGAIFDSYGSNGGDGDGSGDGHADGDGKGGGGDGSGTGGNEIAALDSLLKSPRCPREYCVGCRALVFCCECEVQFERHSPLRRSPSPPLSPSPRVRPPVQIEGASPMPPFRTLAVAAMLAERQVPLWKQRQAAGLPVGPPRRHWQLAPMAPELAVLRPSRSLPPMGLSNG